MAVEEFFHCGKMSSVQGGCVWKWSDSSFPLLPELKAISLFHHGAYKDIPNVRKQLIEYAKKHEIKLTGKFRNLYIEGPPQHKDEKKFIT